MVQISQIEPPTMMTTPQETPSPTEEVEVIWQETLPSDFLGVMACLRGEHSLEEAYEESLNLLAVGVMSAPGIRTLSTST